jgi:hypothetical protein
MSIELVEKGEISMGDDLDDAMLIELDGSYFFTNNQSLENASDSPPVERKLVFPSLNNTKGSLEPSQKNMKGKKVHFEML